MMRKLFRFAEVEKLGWLVVCSTLVIPESTALPPDSEYETQVKMSSSQISMWDLFDGTDFWWGRNRVSAIIPIEDGKCGAPMNLLRAGKFEREGGLDKPILGLDCAPSHDGLDTPSRYGNRWIHFQLTATWSEYTEKRSGAGIPMDPNQRYSELKADAGKLLDFDNKIFPDDLDELLGRCKPICYSVMTVGSYFAKANYYDSIGRPMTASIWRLEGLENALHMADFRQENADALVHHLQAAINFADETSDFRIAGWLVREWEMHLPQQSEKLQHDLGEFIEDWGQQLQEVDSPIAYTLPLLTETPISDHHAANYRGLSSKEFKIDVLTGSIEYAFLDCGERLFNVWSQKQVELQISLRRGWRVPPDWEDCALMILGEQGSKIRVWELPDGTLDANGNLST